MNPTPATTHPAYTSFAAFKAWVTNEQPRLMLSRLELYVVTQIATFPQWYKHAATIQLREILGADIAATILSRLTHRGVLKRVDGDWELN